LNTAIHNSIAAGVTYVVAAGNDAMDAASFSPANHPEVITVSAIADSDGACGGLGASTSYGADDTFATFSNYGSLIEIASPGVRIYSTYKGGAYATLSGTSMSSPHVAGAAAQYLATDPGATPAQVAAVLISVGTPQSDACGFSGDPDTFAEPLVDAAGL
jgi:subtilisin family serine protease